MKTKKMVVGSLLAVSMLVMLPSISAVKYKTMTETNDTWFIEKIKNKVSTMQQKIGEKSLSMNKDESDLNELLELLKQLIILLLSLLPLLIEFLKGLLGEMPTAEVG
jgi:hypothetical protein